MTANKQELLDWACKVSDALSEIGTPGAKDAGKSVEDSIASFREDFFSLAILGKAKRGKSTLINAILGRNDDTIAPTDKLPASSAISIFRWSGDFTATVSLRDGHTRAIGLDEIRDFVTEELNPENGKGVRSVEISGPFPRLEPDLVIVDTPGAGSIHEHHDELLHAYIPQADAVIFLVTARMPLDQDELNLLKELKAADITKIFFAMNRVDECTEEDIKEAIRHNRELLSHHGIEVSAIHRISALQAFKGEWERSGCKSLCDEIEGFLDENKGRVIATRFIARVCSSVGSVAQPLTIRIAAASKSVERIESELEALRRRKAEVESERKFAEREFTNIWERAASDYETELVSAKKTVVREMSEKIENIALTDLGSFSKRLPTELNALIEETLRPIARRFEETARSACEKLQTNYPAVRFGSSDGMVTISRKDDNLAVGGAVGGAIIATTGGGLAMAGASAASAIAAANAAAIAATTTVAAPSVLSGIIGLASTYFPAAAYLAPLATGTATVAAPAALTTAPLWVALAGPVGWTLAGVGLFAIPFSWRLSKLKAKSQLLEITTQQVEKIFNELIEARMRKLRELGRSLAEQIRIRLDRQMEEIEEALVSGIANRDEDPQVLVSLAASAAKLEGLLVNRPVLTPPASASRT